MGRYVGLLLLVLAVQTLQTSVAAERALDGTLHADEPAGVRRDFGDLPLYEVRANGASETLGLLITGDGGWADLDQHVSAALAQKDISIVALSSLKYFWNSRTPYDAFLQGQFRHSELRYGAGDFDRLIGEAWVGATWTRPSGLTVRYALRAESPELRHGLADRVDVWGSVYVSFAF